jgi:hypothetical protein
VLVIDWPRKLSFSRASVPPIALKKYKKHRPQTPLDPNNTVLALTCSVLVNVDNRMASPQIGMSHKPYRSALAARVTAGRGLIVPVEMLGPSRITVQVTHGRRKKSTTNTSAATIAGLTAGGPSLRIGRAGGIDEMVLVVITVPEILLPSSSLPDATVCSPGRDRQPAAETASLRVAARQRVDSAEPRREQAPLSGACQGRLAHFGNC